jgi:hypothetical protein
VVSITPRPIYPLERPVTHCTGGSALEWPEREADHKLPPIAQVENQRRGCLRYVSIEHSILHYKYTTTITTTTKTTTTTTTTITTTSRLVVVVVVVVVVLR